MAHTLTGFQSCGLGESDPVAVFRAVSRNARDAALAGDSGAAHAHLQNAEAFFWQIPDRGNYQDELDYTRAIVVGDQAARSDYSEGHQRLLDARSRPEPSVLDAWRDGFAEGWGEGWNRLKRSVSWRSPLVWIGGGVVAIVLVSQVRGLTRR